MLFRSFGRDVTQLSRREIADMRRRIGVVFQDFRLIAHLSAVDNVALPLRIAGVRESEVQKNVRELLAWVGLGDHLDALPATLSGGQQQRVAIARAVITRPSLLLADEPTGNVDDQIGLRLLYLFEELNKLGTTVVVATHNEALVARFRHRQLRIEDHSLRAIGPGISEALIATAVGLFAAIPAAVAYNHFGHVIKEMGARMDDFTLEFLNLTERTYGE